MWNTWIFEECKEKFKRVCSDKTTSTKLGNKVSKLIHTSGNKIYEKVWIGIWNIFHQISNIYLQNLQPKLSLETFSGMKTYL